MKKNKLLIIGLVISIITWVTTIAFELDLFELFVETLHKLEIYEIDEIIIPSFIFIIFALVNQTNQKRKIMVEQEKLKIYKAMLSSTHHIINNFLQKMQYFKFTAEKMPEFPKNLLDLYEQNINDAKIQIKALGSVDYIDELSINKSVYPQ